MRATVTFAVVALACLVVGVPLWTAVVTGSLPSLAVFSDPGFWVAVGIGGALLLLGFSVGQRSDGR